MTELPKYAKIRAFGDARVGDLLNGHIYVEEKADGSQFRFGKFDGQIKTGSHLINYSSIQPVDAMFVKADQYIRSLDPQLLREGVVYYAEWFATKNQCTLVYDRTPTNGLMLFDVYDTNKREWFSPDDVAQVAASLGIDGPHVITVMDGSELTKEKLNQLIEGVSYLGGATQEGVVVKNYEKRHEPAEFESNVPVGPVMAKAVRKAFVEANRMVFGQGDGPVEKVLKVFGTPVRWEKALNHAREAGKIQGRPQDIAVLIEELDRDIAEEVEAEAKQILWNHFKRDISNGLKRGLPQWYLARLTEQQFTAKEASP